eukprot:122935_1
MLYLVYISAPQHFPSKEAFIQAWDGPFKASFHYIYKLKDEGKILFAGVVAGRKEMRFVADCADNHEIDELIHEIPAWVGLDVKVETLVSPESRYALDEVLAGNVEE